MSKVPFKIWGSGLEQESIRQMQNACSLPVAAAALMPDAHLGYGLPIGGVLATRNAVIPYAVGVDIACRMKLSVLDIPVKDLEHDLLRRPCHIHPGGELYVVADLAGRVTLLDRSLALVGQLFDQPDAAKRARNDVLPPDWKDGEFISPHCANFDSKGNLYVTDWVSTGRITKLARVE